jgi:hypothetical protein
MRRNHPSWASWFLTSEIRPRAGFAAANRLLLMGFFHSALDRSRLSFLVTTQEEALQELARTRPGLLIVTEQLEEGSGLSLVAQAREVVPDIRTVLIEDDMHNDLVEAGAEPTFPLSLLAGGHGRAADPYGAEA